MAKKPKTQEELRVWPPKTKWGMVTLLKYAEAVVFRRDLVWLRDYDGESTLTVARPFGKPDENGYQPVKAARYWPQYRKVSLLDDGTIEKNEHAEYVVQWIPHEEKAQLAAFIKNHEIYQNLPET